MNIKLFALAFAIAATPVISQAADNSGFFINGNVGRSALDKGVYDDNDTAYGANLGYRWQVAPNAAIGVEGGYVDLGKFSPKGGTVVGVRDAELKGWTAGVNGKFNLTDNWYVGARGGLFRGDASGDRIVAGVPVSADAKDNGWYAGAGFGYDVNRNVSVGLNYDHYKHDRKGLVLDPGLVSVGAEVRF